jgi:hypothetical protein
MTRNTTALLIDVMGGGKCKIHGNYFGVGKYGLRACPLCDINEHYRKLEE